MTELPEVVANWLLTQLGEYQVAATYRQQVARTGVWRVVAKDSECIVKLHGRKLRWHTEVIKP